MSGTPKWDPRRSEKYWHWFAAALYLLFTLDILTTLLATAVHGLEAEANPVMRWLIQQGPVVLIAANLVALIGVVIAFNSVVNIVNTVRHPYDIVLEVLVEIWLGLLLTAGIFVVVNNLAVIIFGESFI